jgi:hypothetical protein
MDSFVCVSLCVFICSISIQFYHVYRFV